jgi:hypothetical protein
VALEVARAGSEGDDRAAAPDDFPAQAPEAARAFALLDEALSLVDQARWREAKGKLEEARAAAELPNIVFHLARTHLRLSEPSQARVALSRFNTLASAHNPNRSLAARLELAFARPGLTASPDSSPPARRRPLGPILTLAGGGAALIASLTTGLLASAAEGELERNCAENGVCPDPLASVQTRGERLKLSTNLLLGVGGAAVVAGASWWLLGRDPERPQASLMCTRDGCHTSAKVSF